MTRRTFPTPGSARKRVVVAVAAVTTALVLSACGGGSEDDSAKEPTPAETMAQAKVLFDEAQSVHLELSTESAPEAGSNGVLGASGDITSAPAFEGEVKVVLAGVTATVPVTSVGGKVYAKLPLSTGYATIDPTEYGAPDPADFADPDTGLSALLTQLTDLEKGKEKRSGDQILTTYSGTLPGKAVQAVIPSASAEETYATEVGVDPEGYAVTVEVTGVFFDGPQDVTYDLALSKYGQDVEITAPAS